MAKRTLVANDILMAKMLYSFRFPTELVKEIEKLAKKEHRNLTNYLELLMIQKIEESKKKK